MGKGRGGFPGGAMGGANMANLMKQAQRMQRQMEEAQAKLEEVEVTATGSKEITKVHIDPEAVDPDDVEMLEDLVMAATNEALHKIDEITAASMPKMPGGLGF